MPSPEQREGAQPPEQEPKPYFQAARFRGERAAGRAYFQAQETIYGAECDVSAFRFHLDRIWHVAVAGEQPPEELAEQIERILSACEPTTLPPEIVQMLQERSSQARKRQWGQVADCKTRKGSS